MVVQNWQNSHGDQSVWIKNRASLTLIQMENMKAYKSSRALYTAEDLHPTTRGMHK